MSPEQWKLLFTNTETLSDNIKKIGMAIQGAQQLYSQYYAYQRANMDAELRKYEVNSARKKKRLELELKSGQINQETYKRLSLQLDEELEAKKEEFWDIIEEQDCVKTSDRDRVKIYLATKDKKTFLYLQKEYFKNDSWMKGKGFTLSFDETAKEVIEKTLEVINLNTGDE